MRPLGFSERFTWMIDQTKPINVVLAATITGPLTVQQITQALAQVQSRHPLLAVKITVDVQAQPQFIADAGQIPLRIEPRQSQEHWRTEVNLELSRPFNWQQSPLVRVTVLQAADSCDLILTFHHAIGDGLSGVYLLRDILQALHQPDTPLQTLPALPACEDRYPYCVLAISPSPVAEQADHPLAGGFDLQTDTLTDWQPQLLYWSLSSEETALLISCCRQAQTSVHGALSTAFLSAIAEEDDSQTKQTLQCLSMVNLRPYLVPPIEENFGSYISAGITSHSRRSLSNFWQVARTLKQQLHQQIMSGKLFEGIPASIAFWSTQPDASTIYQIAASMVATDLLITNLGAIPMPEQLPVQQLYVATPGLKTQTFVVAVVTLQGQLMTSIRYPEPVISRACAERVSQKARQRLLAALHEPITSVIDKPAVDLEMQR